MLRPVSLIRPGDLTPRIAEANLLGDHRQMTFTLRVPVRTSGG